MILILVQAVQGSTAGPKHAADRGALARALSATRDCSASGPYGGPATAPIATSFTTSVVLSC